MATASDSEPASLQAYHGHPQALEVLLQREREVDQGDEAGRTPLALAALRGHAECVHTLLGKGASPRSTDTQYGRNAVHLAGGFSFHLPPPSSSPPPASLCRVNIWIQMREALWSIQRTCVQLYLIR